MHRHKPRCLDGDSRAVGGIKAGYIKFSRHSLLQKMPVMSHTAVQSSLWTAAVATAHAHFGLFSVYENDVGRLAHFDELHNALGICMG